MLWETSNMNNTALSNCSIAVGRKWDYQHLLEVRDKNITKTHCCNLEILPIPKGFKPSIKSRSHAVLGPTQATCCWWAAPPATCLLHSLIPREEQAQNTFAFIISPQDNVSLLLLPSSTQGRGREINLCPILGAYIHIYDFLSQEKLSALLYQLFWICFLGFPVISHYRSWTCFPTEGLSPAGCGGHCIHLRRVSLHLVLTIASPWQLGQEGAAKSCSLQGWAAKDEQFSGLDEAPTGGPSKSHRGPLGRYHGYSPWCINQPQDYDESPVWYKHETR